MFFFSSCTVSSTLVSKEVVETAVQECSETPDEDRFEFSDWAFVIIILYIYIQSTDTCFTVPQLISVAWYNLDMAWQPFIPKRLSVTTTCGTIAVMRTSRERKAIWGQSAQTTTGVVGFALLLKDTHTNFTEHSTTHTHIYIYIYIYIYMYVSLYHSSSVQLGTSMD